MKRILYLQNLQICYLVCLHPRFRGQLSRNEGPCFFLQLLGRYKLSITGTLETSQSATFDIIIDAVAAQEIDGR